MNHTRMGYTGRFAFLGRSRAPARRRASPKANRLDDYLLELILIDTLAVADPARVPAAERLIHKRIPRSIYPLVMDRFDALSEDADDDADVLALWLPKAALKDNRWKAKMIRWFVAVVMIGGRRVSVGQLIEIARLASAIGAAPQCQRLFRSAFDFDPYERIIQPVSRTPRARKPFPPDMLGD